MMPPMPQPGAYPGYQHPMYPAYPYPGYPPGMPNVNPALGNAFSQFFQPSQQAAAYAAQAMGAAAAAAAANGQSAYPTPSSYMPMYAQQSQRYGSQQPGPSDYGQMRSSPQPMEEGTSTARATAARRQESTDSYRSTPNHPGGGGDSRKPSLQITMPEQPHAPPESNLRGEEPELEDREQNRSGDDGDRQRAPHQSRAGQQTDNNQHLLPPDFSNMPFPDAYITSPSQLFPEIYRNFQMQAMGSFGGESPAVPEEEDNRAFKWPSLNGAKEEKDATGVAEGQQKDDNQ